MSLAVVMPTRGRPERFAEFIEAFTATRYDKGTKVIACLDSDDPTADEYPPLHADVGWYRTGTGRGFAPRLSVEALHCTDEFEAIASFGDDHLPRTPAWDAKLCVNLATMGGGVVYPNDGYQGVRCATAPVISSKIVDALGWYSPPCLSHYWVDDFWMDLGDALGRLRYLGDVLVEHMHPAAHKAEADPTYDNEAHHAEADRVAWELYRHGVADDGLTQFQADVLRVREALA